MAGYTDKREQNFEIKYLRKVLGQVDNRIQVPQSLDAQSLLPLLDGIEPGVLEAPRRRPRWMSLQSGVAYAAAFALIVALFYSMELYRPEMIDGGMRIAGQESQTLAVAASEDTAEAAGEDIGSNDGVIFLGEPDAAPAEVPVETETTPASGQDSEAAPAAISALGIGGVESILLLEQDNTAYYSRVNDSTDPDRQAPVTLEIVAQDSLELIAQLDIPEMNDIDRCFVSENRILVVGQDDNAVIISAFDNTDPANPAVVSSLTHPGEFVDARAYKDFVHIVSFSDEPDNAVTLPHAASEDCLVITAYNPETFESSTKSFIGAKGTIQLHNLNAYIHYEGEDENGEPEYYIAQILLDGMDIELSTVS